MKDTQHPRNWIQSTSTATKEQPLAQSRKEQLDRQTNKKHTEDLKQSVRPPSFSEDYPAAWALFEGRTITNSITNKKNAKIYDGTSLCLERLLKERPSDEKPGIFVSRQKCNEPSWKKSAAKTFDTLVIEFDGNLSREEQLERLDALSTPYTLAVWSGVKSVHAWIFLKKPISEDEMVEYSAILASIFPEADKSVLTTLNKLARFPIDKRPYHQPLLRLTDKIENDTFISWLHASYEKAYAQKIEKGEINPQSEVQNILQAYWEKYGKRNRLPCPICKAKGKDSSNRNLSVSVVNDSLVYHCFRCTTEQEDKNELRKYFSGNSQRNPNALLDSVYEAITGIYYSNKQSKNWYIANLTHEKLLKPVPDERIEFDIYQIYESKARTLNKKLGSHTFSDYLNLLARKTAVQIRNENKYVVLSDGYAIDIEGSEPPKKIQDFRSFFLPLTLQDWEAPPPSPTWESFLKRHADEDDIRLLKETLGFIFSGHNIRQQQFMLIIFGPTDTGKSVLLDYIANAIPDFVARNSVKDCLTKPISAANILGKRVSLSSETSVKARDSERFRSLISGEELYIKKLFKNEGVYPHNCFFLATTNNVAWIENSSENRKRVRAINWNNRVSEADMDETLVDKLLGESAGIIVDCLQAYANRESTRIKPTNSTIEFMEQAGRNSNPVAQWLFDQNIQGGSIFHPTRDIFEQYQNDTRDKRMNIQDFGRKLSQALGAEHQNKANGQRGYTLNLDNLYCMPFE